MNQPGVPIDMLIRSKYIVLVFAAFSLCGAGGAWCSPGPAGSAAFIKGDVAVEREGRRNVLRQGDEVLEDDTIRTGTDSAAEIVLVDQTRFRIAENTSLEITEYRYDPAEKVRYGLLSLMYGKARFAVHRFEEFADTRFRVQTRTALVGSRDTDFIVVSRREAARDCVCREGLVEALCLEHAILVFGTDFIDQPVLLIPDMISQVCGPNLPTPPRFVTPAERASILQGLEQMESAPELRSGSPEAQ